MYAGGIVLLLLAGTGLLVAAIVRLPTLSEAVLAAYVAVFAEVVGLSLFLSLFGDLTRGALIGGAAAVFVGAGAVWLLRGTPRVPCPIGARWCTSFGAPNCSFSRSSWQLRWRTSSPSSWERRRTAGTRSTTTSHARRSGCNRGVSVTSRVRTTSA